MAQRTYNIHIFRNNTLILSEPVGIASLTYQFILAQANIHADLHRYRMHLPNGDFFNLGVLNNERMVEDLEPMLNNSLLLNAQLEFRIMDIEFRDPTELLPMCVQMEDDEED
mmetsp:Transcript_6015/g.8993  ORF Transcript_6015/g.8993 Transcript_6015/m.8993 type:complete len:112 (-) Transcript_6015:26-361(-)